MAQSLSPKNGRANDQNIRQTSGSSSPRSPRSPSLSENSSFSQNKVSNPNFTGKWKLKEYIGVEDYLKSEGWNWMMRKALSKMANTQFIYHRSPECSSPSTTITSPNGTVGTPSTPTESADGSTEQFVIRNVNRDNEQISINLAAKQEVRYKDRSGNKVISVFKWNRSRTEVMEFRLTELKTATSSHSSSSRSTSTSTKSSGSRRRSRSKAQKSYTESRWLDEKGQMTVSITNQMGKRCTSIYVKEEDCSVPQIAHFLGIDTKRSDGDDHKQMESSSKLKSTDPLCELFPLDIVDIVRLVETASSPLHSGTAGSNSTNNDTNDTMHGDDEKLNEQNVAIQREIQRIRDQMAELQKELDAKTEELRINIARNDERIERDNVVRKWREFEADWMQWDSYSLIGWLLRIPLDHRAFSDYKCTSKSIDRFCSMRFGTKFGGQCMLKMDVEAVRKMGINDEADALCIWKQMESVMSRYPQRGSYGVHNGRHIPGADLKAFLNGMGMSEYFEDFCNEGFEDLNTIKELVRHKGIDYVENTVLSKKLKINDTAHRMQIVEGIKKLMTLGKATNDEHNGRGVTVESLSAVRNNENVL